jgi:hypothetical protein
MTKLGFLIFANTIWQTWLNEAMQMQQLSKKEDE